MKPSETIIPLISRDTIPRLEWIRCRAFAEGRSTYDSIIADPVHTNHCSEYLINMTTWGIDFRTMPIKVFVGYAGCYYKGDVMD